MLPNIITIVRLLSSILLASAIYYHSIGNIWAFVVFLLIIFTDFLDGYIARKYNKITKLGKALDPIADKVLVVTITIALLCRGLVPLYILIIFLRDIIIFIMFITIEYRKKEIIAANIYGKLKTFFHFLAISLVLILNQWNDVSSLIIILAFLTMFPEISYLYNKYLRKDIKFNIEEIISKKEKGLTLKKEELAYAFDGYLEKDITDEQMGSLLKAIYKNGLDDQEIYDLTDIFINSGDTLNLTSLGKVIDKHSTGGVGDKTTLIVGPIVAVCGIKMPKMSGKALGHTGGTIDKLQSIKGIKVDLTAEEFIEQIEQINLAVTSQTDNLVPLDKKIYALRNITNTIDSLGLIAVSIMSKKIACGSPKILIDIKVGEGGLIKTVEEARKLAKIMINIGQKYNRKVKCLLTRMDNPLGDNIGNAIEIKEVIDILKNKKRNNLSSLCIDMSTEIIQMVKRVTKEEAKKEVLEVLDNQTAYNKFKEFIKYQGGTLEELILKNGIEIISQKEGYINSINSYNLGELSHLLAIDKKNTIDYEAGIIINKNVGDYVKKNEVLCTIYGNNNINSKLLINSFEITKNQPKIKKTIIEVIN